MDSTPTLVCFAVKEEAKFFKANNGRILITGMGRKNAGEALRKELASLRPGLVLTCGFAGGLNPNLSLGDIVFDADAGAGLGDKLIRLGGKAARFHCSERIVITAGEKQSLWQAASMDAVEMESSAIRDHCREQKIPSATIRVISDTQQEDLPMDFNTLMTPDCRMNMPMLVGRLFLQPQKIPQLIQFQKRTIFAAQKLDELLGKLLAG
jgi:nucleoside phosphorylase